jgi:large subunit ribosomal protein L4
VASVHLLAVDQLNTYDVLLCDDVIFTKGAFDAFVNGTAAATARPATIVQPPAHDEIPAEETPAEETPAEDAPVEEMPARDTEADVSPVEQTDADEEGDAT